MELYWSQSGPWGHIFRRAGDFHRQSLTHLRLAALFSDGQVEVRTHREGPDEGALSDDDAKALIFSQEWCRQWQDFTGCDHSAKLDKDTSAAFLQDNQWTTKQLHVEAGVSAWPPATEKWSLRHVAVLPVAYMSPTPEQFHDWYASFVEKRVVP